MNENILKIPAACAATSIAAIFLILSLPPSKWADVALWIFSLALPIQIGFWIFIAPLKDIPRKGNQENLVILWLCVACVPVPFGFAALLAVRSEWLGMASFASLFISSGIEWCVNRTGRTGNAEEPANQEA